MCVSVYVHFFIQAADEDEEDGTDADTEDEADPEATDEGPKGKGVVVWCVREGVLVRARMC